MLIIRSTVITCSKIIARSPLILQHQFSSSNKQPKMTKFSYELGLDKQYDKVKKKSQQQQASTTNIMSFVIIAGLSIVGTSFLIMLMQERKRLKMLLTFSKFQYYVSPFEDNQQKYFREYVVKLKNFTQYFKNEVNKPDIHKQIQFCLQHPKLINKQFQMFQSILKIVFQSKRASMQLKNRALEVGLVENWNNLEQIAIQQIKNKTNIKQKYLALQYLKHKCQSFVISIEQKEEIKTQLQNQLQQWRKLLQKKSSQLKVFIYEKKHQQKEQILNFINRK